VAREPRRPKPVLDPQSLEALFGALLEQVENSRTSEAVDDAQALMFDAWESDDRRKRVALARRALAISADCADAYLLLAQEAAKTPAETLALLAEGVAAGERALGPTAFQDDAGDFWGLIETRPYMRTRQALALALWDAGRREDAVGHAAELLRLNPNDNQGVRYVLLNWRLTLGHDVQAAALLKRYRVADDAQWAWPAALAAFRRSGDGPPARKALVMAIAANRFVTPYLTGRRKLPKTLPPYYAPGEMEEAAIYVAEGGAEAWAATPAALDWLRAQI
jgi:tetratricopeptide (TPR) repeat protein